MRLNRLPLLACLWTLLPLAATAQLDTRSTLNSLARQAEARPQPLAIAEAFAWFVSELGPGRYRVSWTLAPGHYLYRHAFNFTLQQEADGASLPVAFTLPDGLKKTDQFFGDIEAYYDRVSVELSLGTVPGPDARLLIEYQGCADWGFCYPPQRAPFVLQP